MNESQRSVIDTELAKYGAALTNKNSICKNGRDLGVRVVVRGSRLRMEGRDGALIASFGVSADSVAKFVSRYWYWEPV